MAYQVLARKYRPQKFSDVIGQEHVTRTLQNAIRQQRIAHGYIFSGHRGIGKTTVARILAMALNCRSSEQPSPEPCGVCDSCQEIRAGGAVDVIEIDAATNRGIDEIRELRDAARYRPARDRFKIYILDEAHQITDAAFNALLKTLEEPPGHIIFMMATTQPEDIPQTIRSRCQHFSFHAVRFEEIVRQLREIAVQEDISAEEDALAALAEAGDGSMRDALSIMDQAIACCGTFEGATGTTLSAAQVRGLMGNVSSDVLAHAMETVHRNSSDELLKLLDRLMTEGQSPSHFAKQLVRFLRNALVAKVAGEESALLQISSDERKKVAGIAALFSEEDLTRFLNIILRTHDELGYRQEQRFHLELGMLKMVHAHRLLPLEELLSRMPAATSAAGSSSAVIARKPEPRSISAPVPATQSGSRPAVSPFEADRARKTGAADPQSGPKMVDSATPFAAERTPTAYSYAASNAAVAVALAHPEDQPNAEPAKVSIDSLRALLIGALEEQNQHTAADLLARGEWKLDGNQIHLRLPIAEKVIDISLSSEARKLLTQEASRRCGRPMKLNITGGASANGGAANGSGSNGASASLARSGGPSLANGSTAGARQRALDDPIVKRMQEKFGAEVRSVIDHRQGKK